MYYFNHQHQPKAPWTLKKLYKIRVKPPLHSNLNLTAFASVKE